MNDIRRGNDPELRLGMTEPRVGPDPNPKNTSKNDVEQGSNAKKRGNDWVQPKITSMNEIRNGMILDCTWERPSSGEPQGPT
eukprot:12425459-Karenia_brevis.AAC.1